MGENKGLQHVLEKLAQLLTEKTGGAIVPYAEMVQKIKLMSNN